jgi:hypothetical protein
MALVIAGTGEMIWWSSPSFNFGGAVSSFETLLNYKLLLSVISLVIVLAIWGLSERVQKSSNKALQSDAAKPRR